MTQNADSSLERARDLLLAAERKKTAQLQSQVDELAIVVAKLEAIIAETSGRTEAVSEVLVDAIERPETDRPRLAQALQPTLEQAVHSSAREDSTILATALYPVMGPALRKMIAELFTFGDQKSTSSFRVEQVLLIERTTGLLLASSTNTADESADLVSGMLDAIRLFVQDAFNATEHDGLRDLRVGDTSVLVEWGPQAVLASVTKGIPNDRYRHRAAQVLEEVHFNYSTALTSFDGNIAPFDATVPLLDGISTDRSATTSADVSSKGKYGLVVLCLIIVVAVLFFVL